MASVAWSGCSQGGERPDVPDGAAGALSGSGGVSSTLLSLPFAVDHHFVVTGFMGDGADGVTLRQDTQHCLLPRPPAPQGLCRRLRYFPESSIAAGWAGLFWQNEPDNWGERPGLEVAPGAREVAFFAASEPPGIEIAVLVGGIQTPGRPFKDDFQVEQRIRLGGEYEQFTVDLSGVSYESVLGGFGIVITLEDVRAHLEEGSDFASIFIDDIVWR